MDEKHERRRGAFALAALAVALPLFYVLSLGPAMGLWARGYISAQSYCRYAWPSNYLRKACTPYREILQRYESYCVQTPRIISRPTTSAFDDDAESIPHLGWNRFKQ